MRKVSLAFLLMLAIQFVFAQTKKDLKKPSTLIVNVGSFDFKTPQLIRNTSLSNVLANKQWTKLIEQDVAFGVSYMKGLSNHFDFAANYFLTFSDYPFGDGTEPYGSKNMLHEADMSVMMKLFTDNYAVVPYLTAGIGGSAYKGGRFDAFIPLGAGLQFKLDPETFLFTNFQYRVPVTERANYHFVSSIGVGVNIGKKKVPPPPPPPPPPVVVAPKDTDGDGIIDNDDKCPTVAGVAKYLGCPVPDTDKDGVNDDLDKCPTVPGLARLEGCPIPDKDGDGINDEEDKCPDVAGLARLQGCPIPDTDGDGINDEEDKCITVAGPASNYGCPIMQYHIDFATGSAVITSAGKKYLQDEVLPAQKMIGDSRFEIHGHTDNTGSAKINQSLSKRRADAVKVWLVKNGIPADRIETKGFGSTQPIDDNKTKAGRAKNRRVDFKLIK